MVIQKARDDYDDGCHNSDDDDAAKTTTATLTITMMMWFIDDDLAVPVVCSRCQILYVSGRSVIMFVPI